MAIRVRLFGVEKPNVIRTIHRNMLLNARELNHLLSKEELQKIFPNGAGIHFDFSQRSKIVLCPEHNIVSHLNSEPMLAGQEYPLVLGDTKILGINDTLFRMHVVHSFF